jgi:hypothetical protein
VAGARRRDAPTGWSLGVRRSPEGRSLLEPPAQLRPHTVTTARPADSPKLSVPSPNLITKLETTPVGLHRIPDATGTMSIAVMNWVWASSPASRDEGLVLLALAVACLHDDGTGCWPSAATIARAFTSATAPSAARSPGCRLTATWSCTAAAGATNSHRQVPHARMTCTREAPASLDPPNAPIR